MLVNSSNNSFSVKGALHRFRAAAPHLENPPERPATDSSSAFVVRISREARDLQTAFEQDKEQVTRDHEQDKRELESDFKRDMERIETEYEQERIKLKTKTLRLTNRFPREL